VYLEKIINILQFMNEFRRMILKVSSITNDVATIPTTNDHTDGSWLSTDIYIGELFLNVADDILQTRTDAGIVEVYGGVVGVDWGSISGTLSNQTDLATALDNTTLIQPKNIGGVYQLIPSDRNQNLENDGDCVVEVDGANLVSLPIGGQIFFTKKAEGLRFSSIGGIIINSVDGLLEMGRINCGASLLKIGSIEYNLIGELV